jgi:hypothetical protein
MWNVLFKLADALGVDCRAFAECAASNGRAASKVGEAKKPRGRRRRLAEAIERT